MPDVTDRVFRHPRWLGRFRLPRRRAEAMVEKARTVEVPFGDRRLVRAGDEPR